MVDAAGCTLESISSRETIVAFTKDLIKRIDMVAFGEPIVEHFATHDPAKAGYSMVQLIETSNLAAHFVDKTGEMYLDVFSCKPYNNQDVIDCVKEYFNPEKIKINFVTRHAT
jgi:S-adenosylmethionine decarboxylase